MICLDRNERVSAFPDLIISSILREITSTDFSLYPNLGPLYSALEKFTGLDRNSFCVGNGSDGLIRRIFQAYLAPNDICISPTPTYGMYGVWASVFGAQYKTVPYSEGSPFRIDLDKLLQIVQKGCKVCCIANPDQPTGTVLTSDQLGLLAETTRKNNALLLIDEAYYPFYSISAQNLLFKYDNIVIVRTFSKAFGLAGLRVGYAMAAPSIIDTLQKVRSPGEVNAIGAKVATYFLENYSAVEEFIADVEKSRISLVEAASQIGYEVPKCYGNFQLLKMPTTFSPSDLQKKLEKENYLIKAGFSYPGLENYVRVTLDKSEIINPFIVALQKVTEMLVAGIER